MKPFRCCSLLMLLALPSLLIAQPELPVPELSQKAYVTQTVGLTDIAISYHRPGVKNRQIWGRLVPYGDIWRAGANENTTISFSTPVRIEGHPLAAGTYGLHMIGQKDEWTVIFSNNATSWGSFFYKQDEDALRVKVKPQQASHQEWLLYTFDDLSDSSAVISLTWDQLRIPFSVSTDVHAIVLKNTREAYLRGLAAFSWQGWNQAAAYCLRYGINLVEAMTWVDRSISMQQNFSNLRVKAGLLDKLGKTKEAGELRARSLKLASEADLNTLGYQHLQAGRLDEALEIFKQNARAHPESWNVFDSLGEAYERANKKEEAVANYEKALKMVADETQKKRITTTLERLKAE